MQIDRAFEPLFGWFAARGLLGPETRSIGVYYDDPFSVAEEQLRSCSGLVVERRLFRLEAPLIETIHPRRPVRGAAAQGPYAAMRAAYQWLYGTWLPQSGGRSPTGRSSRSTSTTRARWRREAVDRNLSAAEVI